MCDFNISKHDFQYVKSHNHVPVLSFTTSDISVKTHIYKNHYARVYPCVHPTISPSTHTVLYGYDSSVTNVEQAFIIRDKLLLVTNGTIKIFNPDTMELCTESIVKMSNGTYDLVTHVDVRDNEIYCFIRRFFPDTCTTRTIIKIYDENFGFVVGLDSEIGNGFVFAGRIIKMENDGGYHVINQNSCFENSICTFGKDGNMLGLPMDRFKNFQDNKVYLLSSINAFFRLSTGHIVLLNVLNDFKIFIFDSQCKTILFNTGFSKTFLGGIDIVWGNDCFDVHYVSVYDKIKSKRCVSHFEIKTDQVLT